MSNEAKWLDLPARLLMSLLFLFSGYTKLSETTLMQGYMHAFGVPPVLIWPAAALEIGGGLLLLTGLYIRPLSAVLAFWCLLTASIFHTHWSDPVQQIMFLKNMTMAGGFLILALYGTVGAGLDRRLTTRSITP